MLKKEQRGFTLIELVIVIGLIAVTVGVAGDIILSLVRSYGRTQVTNEVEQTASLATQKIEKELRTAIRVTSPDVSTAGEASNSITFVREINGNEVDITYFRNSTDSFLYRQEGSNNPEPLLADVRLTNADIFLRRSTNPDVVIMRFVFEQGETNPAFPFQASVELNQTVVVRGTY